MHEAAHTVDLALARELIAASFPEHGDAVLRPISTIGLTEERPAPLDCGAG